FQTYALYPHLTVKNNMGLGLKQAGTPAAEIDRRIGIASSMLSLEPYLARRPAELSGGQRQRVAIGRAVVREPKLFLFDEPLSNLDAALRVNTRLEIAQLHRRLKATMIYVTHDQVEAMTLASRIAVMNQGSVQQFDTPKRIYDRPTNMFVAGFMGSPAMNFIPARLTGSSSISVRAADGSDATLALAAPLPAGAPKDVVLGVRPEHIYRFTTDLKSRKPAVQPLQAPVELVEPTGAETLAVLRLGDLEITGRFEPDDAPVMGETITLGIDMSRACLFDPATRALL
ncbi:MAG: ATP-binding cassette domain-containing protein, partial [Mesorhizobium sp.]